MGNHIEYTGVTAVLLSPSRALRRVSPAFHLTVFTNLWYSISASAGGDHQRVQRRAGETVSGRIPRLRAAAFLLLLPAALWSQDEEDAFKLARNLFRDAGDWATSAELFSDFIRNWPVSSHLPEARLMLARSLDRSGRCDQAIKAYEDFYQNHADDSNTSVARLERAGCLRDEGHHTLAAAAFEEVQRLFSAGEFAPRALLAAATEYASVGDLEAAARSYRLVLSDYADSDEAVTSRLRLAQVLFAAGEANSAQDVLAELEAKAPISAQARDGLLLSGRISLFMSEPEAASQAFSRLRRDHPGSPHADSGAVDLARHLLERGDHKKAAAAFVAARDRVSDESLMLQASLGLGDAQRAGSAYPGAIDTYQALLASSPQGPEARRARLGLAIAFGWVDEFAAALTLFLDLARAPDGSGAESTALDNDVRLGALRELGSLCRRQGDFSRAITWFHRYLVEADRVGDTGFAESRVQRDLVRLNLAHAYIGAGHSELAIAAYRQLQSSPSPLAEEAHRGLAEAYERSGSPRLALAEYRAFMERFPGLAGSQRIHDRIEYLSDFTVLDPSGLSRVIQQAYLDEVNGRSPRSSLLNLAHNLKEFHDYANAARTFETYAASFGDDASVPEAQYWLAECLGQLARQRQLEGRLAQSDSLRKLSLQELRILSEEGGESWSRRARLRLIQAEADAAPDSSREQILEADLTAFLDSQQDLSDSSGATDDAAAEAVILLADLRRRRARSNAELWPAAAAGYSEFLRRFAPTHPLRHHARFGLAVCLVQQGEVDRGVDSLETLLGDMPSSPVVAEALFALGQALIAQERHDQAVGRFREILMAYPSFIQRRTVLRKLADTHFLLGEVATAVKLYRQVAEWPGSEDESYAIRCRLAESHSRLGQHREALETYDKLLSMGAAEADSIDFERGRTLVRLKQVDEALRVFTRLSGLGESPVSDRARRHGADLLFEQSRYAEAHDMYSPLVADGDRRVFGRNVICLWRLDRVDGAENAGGAFVKRYGRDSLWPSLFRLEEGRHYLRGGIYEKAEEIFAKLERETTEGEKPKEFEDESALLAPAAEDIAAAAAYFAATARWEANKSQPSEKGLAKALKAQMDFLDSYPDNPFAARTYLRRGEFHYTHKRYLRAAGDFKRVLEDGGTKQEKERAIWMLLAAYTKSNAYDNAYRTALRLTMEFPDHSQTNAVQLEIGYILSQMGQYTSAITHLEGVLEWASGDQAAEARYLIGEAYQNKGEYRTAIKRYYDVSYHSTDASSQWITNADYKRATCHEALGEFTTAISIYEKIIRQNGSDSSYGKAARKAIDSLRERGED